MSTYKPTVIISGRENQLDDPDGLAVAHITTIDYLDFDLTPNIPGHQTGRLHWHNADGTLSLGMIGSEVELQIGQEHLILVTNNTGNTINNGTPVYFTGEVINGRSAVATANAARNPNPVPSFVRGLLTETIGTGNEGYMLIAGLMRDVNTANWAPGTQLFLATTEGEYANPRPEAPDNVRGLGVVIEQHATEGSILVSLDPIYDLEWASNVYSEAPFETDQFLGWQPDNSRYELLRSQRNFFNGTTRETFDAVISSADATTIQLTLEQAGTGNLTMQFTDGDTQLVCDPTPQTINITPGTDTTPTGTMVYVPYSTKTLASGSAWPSEEHIKICYMSVPSAQFVFDHGGPYVNQNWNDHLSDTAGVSNQGHLSHIAGKIRLGMGANWYSGVGPEGQDVAYYTFPAASTIYWESAAGVIAQLHTQNFGAKDTGNGNIILVANDSVAPYVHVSNLFDITADSTGNTIGNNRYFSLIFWGVQNKTDQGSGVMVNLPGGNYTGESSAINDVSNYDDYNFPREFTLDSGTAFLICRSTFKMGVSSWTHVQTEDLRGKVPSNQVGGGSGGGVTDHGALGGLADDDHTQYALVDGSRAFTGNVTLTSANMSGYITGYGGTPSDGQVLGWVTANTRFEPVTNPAGVTDHGALTGLTDDDHTQYILVDGTRAFTGNVTISANTLTLDGWQFEWDATNNIAYQTLPGGVGHFERVAPDSFPACRDVMLTVGSSSAAKRAITDFVHRTSTLTLDGHGAGITFSGAAGSNDPDYYSGIYGRRDGGDTTGNLEFWTRNAGVFTSKMTISPAGNVTIPTGTITANNIDSPASAGMVLASTDTGTAAFTADLTINSVNVNTVEAIGIGTANILSPSGSVNFFTANLTTSGSITTTGTGDFGLLIVDSITIQDDTITSNTGTVNFVDDHIATTGNITCTRIAVGGGTSVYNATVLIDETVNTTNFVFGMLMEGDYTSQDNVVYGVWLNPSVNPGNFSSSYIQSNSGMVVADTGETVVQAVNTQIGGMSKTGTGDITTAIGLYVSEQSIGDTNYSILVTGGDCALQSDNAKQFYGASDDASFYYDSTDLVCDPKEVGTGNFHVLGAVVADEGMTSLGTGTDCHWNFWDFKNNVDATVNGTMKVRLPDTWYNGWMRFKLVGQQHELFATDPIGPWELDVAGYPYIGPPANWFAEGCSVTGWPPFNQVRMGHDGTGLCLLLGTEDSVWAFPRFTLHMQMHSGWTQTVTPTVDFSTDEAVDWSITEEVPCPMYLAPGIEIEDAGDGDVKVNVKGDSLELNGSEVVKVLGENKTIYLRTTGNDSNGGYASDDAFLTPERAVNELYRWAADGYYIFVDVGEGTFNCTAALTPSYAYGSNVYWNGVYYEYTSLATSNIDASATDLSTGLEYIDMDVTIPAGTGAVGDFLIIKTTSAGAWNVLTRGCHEVVSWNGTTNVATVRIVRRDGCSVFPSGAVVLDTCTLVKSVLNFSASNGLKVNGAYQCCNWDRLVFKGSISYDGIWMLNGASITLGVNFGTSGWDINLHAQNGGSILGDTSTHSYSNSYLVSTNGGSAVSVRYGAILSGGRTTGMRCFNASIINAYDVEVYCAGSSYGAVASKGGFIDAELGWFYMAHASVPYAFYVTSGGGIDSSGSATDVATPRGTEIAPGGNGAYHVY